MSSSATKPMVWYGCVCGLIDSAHTHTHTHAMHKLAFVLHEFRYTRQRFVCSCLGKQTVVAMHVCMQIRRHTHSGKDVQTHTPIGVTQTIRQRAVIAACIWNTPSGLNRHNNTHIITALCVHVNAQKSTETIAGGKWQTCMRMKWCVDKHAKKLQAITKKDTRVEAFKLK